MANETACTSATITTAAACLVAPTIISPQQQRAIRIQANLLELAEIGGETYADLATLYAASCDWQNMNEAERLAASTAVELANAVNAGATVPSDINELLELVKCLSLYSDKQLDAIERFVRCQLGYHSGFVT